MLADLPRGPVTSIVGAGGVGKTRTAHEAARLAATGFPDGVVVVSLGTIRQSQLVAGAVASALALPSTGGAPYDDALVAWLNDRRILLVLDNCEHVLDAVAPLVDVLTQRLEHLRVLATSREPLEVPGETVHRLSPLRSPALDASAEEVAASDAVRLFVDRARARTRGFTLHDENRDAVAEICRRLDGLPLAIELAAARVGALAPDAIARRLDDRFRLLVGGPHAGDARHRTLRAVVAWSDALLDQQERRVLRRISVFSGFDLTAAAVVTSHAGPAGGTDDGAIVHTVGRLVEKSLIVHGNADVDRYSLLETIRGYASEQLEETGEAEATRDAHAAWFEAFGTEAGAALMGGDERTWLHRLADDHDNLRAALRHLLAGAAPERALQLATALSLFWWTHGHRREGIGWLRAGLDAAPLASTELRAAGLFHLAFLWAHDTDDWAHAAVLLDEAITLAESDPDVVGSPIHGYALCFRGQAANNAGEHARALDLTTRGLAIVRSFPDPWGAGFALWNVGHTHVLLGDLEAGEACFVEMAEVQRAHGIGLVLMIACQSLAELAERRGDATSARALHEEALALRRGLGAARLGYVHGSLPGGLVAVARAALAEGDLAAAAASAAEAVPLAVERREEATLAEARAVLAAAERASATHVGALWPRGAVWVVEWDGESVLLPDVKGLGQLRELLSRPGKPVAAAELASSGDGGARPGGDAGPMLDETARRAYRQRLVEIEQEIEEAQRFHDPERAAAAERERTALVAELRRATGLGGRERRAGSGAERARINVTRTLREAIARITAECPSLGAHLDRSVRTGTSCQYTPHEPAVWRL